MNRGPNIEFKIIGLTAWPDFGGRRVCGRAVNLGHQGLGIKSGRQIGFQHQQRINSTLHLLMPITITSVKMQFLESNIIKFG